MNAGQRTQRACAPRVDLSRAADSHNDAALAATFAGSAHYQLMGDGARQLMTEAGPPRLLRRFVAESHFEAMTIYNRILGRGPYESDFAAEDTFPYPDAWRHAQESAGVTPDDVAPER